MPDSEKSNIEPMEELDSATVTAITEGLDSEKKGNFSSLEDAVKFARDRRELWKKASKSESA
jgi:hypothetical protein